MTIHVDIWLRGDNFATTESIAGVASEPKDWVDADVKSVLEGMLHAMYRLKFPGGDPPPVALRGFSWIVNRYEDAGVVIAIEFAMGAAVAGPFAIGQPKLETMIERVLAGLGQPASDRVH